METVGDALKEIDAALKAPRLNRAKESVLHSLRETIREAFGLARDPKKYKEVDQAILKQNLPTHIRQLVNARLIEIGYTR